VQLPLPIALPRQLSSLLIPAGAYDILAPDLMLIAPMQRNFESFAALLLELTYQGV